MLAALGLAACDEQVKDSVRYVPSPTGQYRVQNVHPDRSALNIVSLLTPSDGGRMAATEMARYPTKLPEKDTVVVGWDGDAHLKVGWPAGETFRAGPTQVGGVRISYINYERDLSKAVPTRLDQVTLRDVTYTAETVPISFGPDSYGLDCTIQVRGKDGTFFDTVTLDIIGTGIGKTRDGIKPRGGGSISLRFALTRLPGLGSPLLSLTQAKLDDFGPFTGRMLGDSGPTQENLFLGYGGYQGTDGIEMFHHLRDGGYRIRFGLTFGAQQIDYLVREPIPSGVAAAYLACEAQTGIFDRLIGDQLSH